LRGGAPGRRGGGSRAAQAERAALGEMAGVEAEAAAPVHELLTAGQAMLVVFLTVAIALSYAYRFWRKIEAERRGESMLDYDFALPAEREIFGQLAAHKPEEKPENAQQLQQWHLKLCQVHFKRVLALIDLHERVNDDYRKQTALYKRGVAVYMLPQVERAKALVDQEVQECGALANQLRPNWAQTVFQDAYKMREQFREQQRKQEEAKSAAELSEADKLEAKLRAQEEKEETGKSKGAKEVASKSAEADLLELLTAVDKKSNKSAAAAGASPVTKEPKKTK
jgi:hypothetical protein